MRLHDRFITKNALLLIGMVVLLNVLFAANINDYIYQYISVHL